MPMKPRHMLPGLHHRYYSNQPSRHSEEQALRNSFRNMKGPDVALRLLLRD